MHTKTLFLLGIAIIDLQHKFSRPHSKTAFFPRIYFTLRNLSSFQSPVRSLYNSSNMFHNFKASLLLAAVESLSKLRERETMIITMHQYQFYFKTLASMSQMDIRSMDQCGAGSQIGSAIYSNIGRKSVATILNAETI